MEVKNRIDVYKSLYKDLILNHNKRILMFSEFRQEYKAFYDYAAVHDFSHSSIFYVTGKDALDFLHRISTNDVLNLQDYSTITTLLLNEKGRIIDRLKLLKFPDHMILIASPENEEKIYRWIERYAVMDEIKLKPLQDVYLYLKIFGKKTEVFFTLLFGDQLKNLEPGKIYKYISNQFQCWIIKDEIFPQHYGYEILSDVIYTENLLYYIHSNLDIFNCRFIGSEAYETIRIEQGEPSFPNELRDAFNPYDVNLIRFVSFTKGCYIGQEVIARLDTYEKVKFNFGGFRFERDFSFQDKLIYKPDFTNAGEITSKTYSPTLNSIVGLGIYSKKLTEDELKNLFVREGDELIKIEVINLPMIQL